MMGTGGTVVIVESKPCWDWSNHKTYQYRTRLIIKPANVKRKKRNGHLLIHGTPGQLTDMPSVRLPTYILVTSRPGQLADVVSSYYVLHKKK